MDDLFSSLDYTILGRAAVVATLCAAFWEGARRLRRRLAPGRDEIAEAVSSAIKASTSMSVQTGHDAFGKRLRMTHVYSAYKNGTDPKSVHATTDDKGRLLTLTVNGISAFQHLSRGGRRAVAAALAAKAREFSLRAALPAATPPASALGSYLPPAGSTFPR